jgi:hypothetical protein
MGVSAGPPGPSMRSPAGSYGYLQVAPRWRWPRSEPWARNQPASGLPSRALRDRGGHGLPGEDHLRWPRGRRRDHGRRGDHAGRRQGQVERPSGKVSRLRSFLGTSDRYRPGAEPRMDGLFSMPGRTQIAAPCDHFYDPLSSTPAAWTMNAPIRRASRGVNVLHPSEPGRRVRLPDSHHRRVPLVLPETNGDLPGGFQHRRRVRSGSSRSSAQAPGTSVPTTPTHSAQLSSASGSSCAVHHGVPSGQVTRFMGGWPTTPAARRWRPTSHLAGVVRQHGPPAAVLPDYGGRARRSRQ